MISSIKKRIKHFIINKSLAIYREVLKLDEKSRPLHEKPWLMGLEGRLTPERKQQMDDDAFLKANGYRINWKNPQSFSEKVMWGLLYYQNPLLIRCNDKFSVKGYVDEVLGPGHVVPTYGWWTDPDDIDYDALPSSFVLKVNWSSGGWCNYYVPDKSKMDKADIRAKLETWLAPAFNVHYFSFRWDAQFDYPVIYAEEYLPPAEAGVILDYKFICCNGRCQAIQVRTPKPEMHYMDWFDRDWNPLDISHGRKINVPGGIKCPRHLKEMLEIAEKLAKPFPFMRVDLYEVEDRILVGELTFAFGGGRAPIKPRDNDFSIGENIELPEFVNFDRLRESDPLPAERAYILDGKLSPELTRRYLERKALLKLFYWPDLVNPRSLNEKLLWTALYGDKLHIPEVADRYEAKRYIAKTVGEQYVIPTLGVYTDTSQIDWASLPERFVGKATANRGLEYLYIVRNKTCDSEGVFKATVSDWLIPWNTWYHHNACLAGRRVVPRIMLEPLMESKLKRLDEYRFYCCCGKVKLVCAACEQSTERESFTYLNPDSWEALPVRQYGKHKRSTVSKPNKLEKMLKLCVQLSKEFQFVRIDCLEVNDHIYINDMSTDSDLFQRLEPVEWDRKLGDLLNGKI